MSEKSERLLAALSGLSDEKLEEAAGFRPRKSWKKPLAHAAVLALAVGLTGSWFLSMRGCGRSGGGGTPGEPYVVYAGPSFPLTLAQSAPDITARRHMTLDFLAATKQWRDHQPGEGVTQAMLDDLSAVYAQWEDQPHISDLLLTDTYTLTNHADADRTVTALYPVPTSLGTLHRDQALVWVDGTPAETEFRFGAYTGPSYENSPWSGARLPVSYPDTWEGWAMQLEGGANLGRALAPFESPAEVPVTVYRFTDPTGPAESDQAPNPSIRVSFGLDYDRTAILPLGFNGWSIDAEGGTMTLGFSIPEPGEPWEEARIIVLGEPVRDLQVQGYVTGGTDADTPVLEGCQVTMEEQTSDLYTELYAALERMDRRPGPEDTAPLLWRELEPVLDPVGALWYSHSMELLYPFWEEPRLVWQELELTIPAGDSVTLTALTRREGSFSVGGGDLDLKSYDFLPTLGSQLTFTGQTAVLEDRGMVELADQDFGFDLEAGVTEVELDLSKPCYHLGVYMQY